MKKLKKFLCNSLLYISGFFFFQCSNVNDIDKIDLIPVIVGAECEFIDTEGKIIINPQFSEATIFRNGLALVKTGDLKPAWGFINKDGKFSIMPLYKSATTFSENLAWVVSENSAPSCINSNGKIVFTLANAQVVHIFSEGLASFREQTKTGEAKWGFVDYDGNVVIAPQFYNSRNFSGGKCAVSNKEGKWGYIDMKGKLFINFQFESAEPFKNGYAIVQYNGKSGLINENGIFVINPQYSQMKFDGDRFLIEQNGKIGWADKDGKILINPQFTKAFAFNNSSLAPVQFGGSFGFIEKEGRILINPQFDFALPFNNRIALVRSSGKFGFIDLDGRFVINPQYDDVPSDLIEYLKNGGSAYNSIQSDFFNVGAIISRINIKNPEGLSFNSTFLEIIGKYNLKQDDFNKSIKEHLLFSSEKITDDAVLTFRVIGQPWGWSGGSGWGYYEFYSNEKPTDFVYTIELIRKGFGKEMEVIDAIESSLTDFKKDENLSGGEALYKNSTLIVRIFKRDNSIDIFISPNIQDNN